MIHDLGIDASTRYAQDRQLYDEKWQKEGSKIPSQTQIDVAAPAYTSEVDRLLEIDLRGSRWADFTPPKGYLEQKRRLFTEQLIPMLGPPDKQEALLQKVQQVEISGKEPYAKELEERSKQTLVAFLENVRKFDRVLIDINSYRSQYHRG